jgi:hypothetical protein
MAKINARGAREIARVTAYSGNPDGNPDGKPDRMIFVLRSDRVILRRFTGDLATGYTKFGKVKPTASLDQATLKRIVSALGYSTDA